MRLWFNRMICSGSLQKTAGKTVKLFRLWIGKKSIANAGSNFTTRTVKVHYIASTRLQQFSADKITEFGTASVPARNRLPIDFWSYIPLYLITWNRLPPDIVNVRRHRVPSVSGSRGNWAVPGKRSRIPQPELPQNDSETNLKNNLNKYCTIVITFILISTSGPALSHVSSLKREHPRDKARWVGYHIMFRSSRLQSPIKQHHRPYQLCRCQSDYAWLRKETLSCFGRKGRDLPTFEHHPEFFRHSGWKQHPRRWTAFH